MLRIVVCIKQVPATDEVRIDPERKTLIREGVPLMINPLDEHAIEAALLIKGQHEGHVTALSMGPPSAQDVLRHALAMGCDDAILLSDPAMAGADTLATSRTLAAAIRKIGCIDLVICGDHSSDGDTGQVGPQVAELLGIPQATFATSVQLLGTTIRVQRLLPGVIETVELPLPALVTVTKEIGRPRRPGLRRLKKAAGAAIPTWGLEELGLDGHEVGLFGSPTKMLELATPPPHPAAQRFELPANEAAARIAEILEREGVA